MIVDDAAAIAAELRRIAPSAMLFRPAPAKCQRCESDWWVRSGCVRCRTCSGEPELPALYDECLVTSARCLACFDVGVDCPVCGGAQGRRER